MYYVEAANASGAATPARRVHAQHSPRGRLKTHLEGIDHTLAVRDVRQKAQLQLPVIGHHEGIALLGPERRLDQAEQRNGRNTTPASRKRATTPTRVQGSQEKVKSPHKASSLSGSSPPPLAKKGTTPEHMLRATKKKLISTKLPPTLLSPYHLSSHFLFYRSCRTLQLSVPLTYPKLLQVQS